jgi:myosin heavy subunit
LEAKDVLAFETQKKHNSAINDLNKLHAERQKAYCEQIESINARHSDELAKQRKLHKDDCERRDKTHAAEVDTLRKDFAKRQQELEKQLQDMDAKLQAERKQNTEKQLQIRREAEATQKEKNDEYMAKITKLQNDYSLLIKTSRAEMQAQLDAMEKQRADYEKRVTDLDMKNKALERTNAEQKSKIRELETSLVRYQDVEAQLVEARRNEEAMRLAKLDLQNQLSEASTFIHQLQEEIYSAKRKSLELLTELKEMSIECEQLHQEIANLKAYIIDLKSRIAVYIPVKDDKVDKKIAEYINNYPDRQKLKILFMRETEGVYQFGTKRVVVKIDKDKINIRVGGGYLSIDEFLDQYTPTELEKIERKDPARKFNDRLAVSNAVKGHMVRDNSPDSPSKQRGSPTKKRAI